MTQDNENPGKRIGYVPYSKDLSHPDDRRRFPYFARRKEAPYEIATVQQHYDIILLPAPSNLSLWMDYKKKHPQTRFIFEMVDGLTHQTDWKNILLRGIGRYIIGKEKRPTLNHRNLLIKWIKSADMVICSNPRIKEEILPWNNNVVLDLDYLQHEYPCMKTDYSIHGKMKLLWEGQGVVLPKLLAYQEVFSRVNSFCELHVVTAPSYPRIGQFLHRKTEDFLKELPITTHFHPWSLEKNASLFAMADCGLIPLHKEDVYGWHKPANKLISYWFSGIPTLASDTPAYTAVAEMTESNFICSSPEEWMKKIQAFRDMTPDERKLEAGRKYQFAKSLFSNEVHDAFWINLLGKMGS